MPVFGVKAFFCLQFVLTVLMSSEFESKSGHWILTEKNCLSVIFKPLLATDMPCCSSNYGGFEMFMYLLGGLEQSRP